MIRLHQTFGAHAGRVRELDQDVITFGRLPTCDVAFDAHADLDASGHHAEIRREAGVWVLRDVGSRNGTLVNGRTVQRHELADGDEIEFGTGGPRVKIELVGAAVKGAGTLAATPILAPPSVAPPEKLYGQGTLDAAVEAAAARARADALAVAETHRVPPKDTAVLAPGPLPTPGLPAAAYPSAPMIAPTAPPPAPVAASGGSSTVWMIAAIVALFVFLSLCLVSCIVFGWLYSRGL